MIINPQSTVSWGDLWYGDVDGDVDVDGGVDGNVDGDVDGDVNGDMDGDGDGDGDNDGDGDGDGDIRKDCHNIRLTPPRVSLWCIIGLYSHCSLQLYKTAHQGFVGRMVDWRGEMCLQGCLGMWAHSDLCKFLRNFYCLVAQLV